MRAPEQIPSIEVYTNPQTVRGGTYKVYPDYEKEGGGVYIVVRSSVRRPDLVDFLFNVPHTPEKVLALVARLLN